MSRSPSARTLVFVSVVLTLLVAAPAATSGEPADAVAVPVPVPVPVAVPVAAAVAAPVPDSPHARPDRCSACHEVAVEPRDEPPPMPSSAPCVRCHPTADMHAVGVKPEHVPVPEAWPLDDGTLGCITCHAEPSCDAERSTAAPWLRGGTPRTIVDFCVRCHTSEDYQRQDPHHPAAARDDDDGSCVVCHTSPPERGATGSDAHLRSGGDAVCAECHRDAAHPGAGAHLGRSLSPAMAAAAGEHVQLDEDGTIRCWTCHEVHGDGAAAVVRPPPGARARSAAEAIRDLAQPDRSTRPAAAHPPLLAAPDGDDGLCRACHRRTK